MAQDQIEDDYGLEDDEFERFDKMGILEINRHKSLRVNPLQ
jgi:hypothetical protein